MNNFVLGWILGCQFLVDVNTKPRIFIGVQIPVSELGCPREQLIYELIEPAPFLNAEVWRPNVEVHVGCIAYGRNISWSVPCCPHIVKVGKSCHIS